MRILIVEDDPAVAEVLADTLRAGGHDPLVSLDALEALSVLEATMVDGVLLDLVMPDLGGLAALARLRATHPTLPVVILSGHADPALTRQALDLGASDVVLKPAALANLPDVLSRLRGTSQA